jgi:hypothetical protein
MLITAIARSNYAYDTATYECAAYSPQASGRTGPEDGLQHAAPGRP